MFPGQHARFLVLEPTRGHGGLPAALTVESWRAHEGVNLPFHAEVILLAPDCMVDSENFLGREFTVSMLLADGGRRRWHGYCTSFSFLEADGGLARYRLTLSSFLYFLEQRYLTHLFQGKAVPDIIAEVFSGYPQANVRFDVLQDTSVRAICTQYRETDFQFVNRLLAAEGLCWRIDHRQTDSADETRNGQASHELVVFDRQAIAPDMPYGRDIRFHRVGATEQSDAIDRFVASRSIRTTAFSVSSWDSQAVLAHGAEGRTAQSTAHLPDLQVFYAMHDCQGGDFQRMQGLASALLDGAEADSLIWEGAGSTRTLAAGHRFSLLQHDVYPTGSNLFRVNEVLHAARNNLGSSGAVAKPPPPAGCRSSMAIPDWAAIQEGTYRNTFRCIRDPSPFGWPADSCLRKPQVFGPHTAIVTGVSKGGHTMDRDHRIRIQFFWQRGQLPNRGGLPHRNALGVELHGNAPGDERSGAWVRVAESLAGPNWGTLFSPRIGTEVLVDFADGDIDCPIVIAQLYNERDQPPFVTARDQSQRFSNFLSGWHSIALEQASRGFNQWILDDTKGQLRLRLASSTAGSECNLGYLVQQRDARGERGSYRGCGFELRTDAWGVVRAAEGLLISTRARHARSGCATSTQMDAQEAVTRLETSQGLAASLAKTAFRQNCPTIQDAGTAMPERLSQLAVGEEGRHPDFVNGQRALHELRPAQQTHAEQAVERFAGPGAVFDSQADIQMVTANTALLQASGSMAWTASSEQQFSAGRTYSSVSGGNSTLFAADGGLRAIAANGTVSMQAHAGSLALFADDSVQLTSAGGALEMFAQKRIELQAGPATVTLEGGHIVFSCPGTFSVMGSSHPFGKGKAHSGAPGELPSGLKPVSSVRSGLLDSYDEQAVYRDTRTEWVEGKMPYRIEPSEQDGPALEGDSPDFGFTQRLPTSAEEPLRNTLRYTTFHDLDGSDSAPRSR